VNVNADFTRRVVLHGARMPWVDSPVSGVQRRMFDRLGGEVARATSLVRYAPGSHFTPHTHGGGEEFIVLEGVFSDEQGHYAAGSYIRNPPTTRHTPHSATGCVIFVKLWQFDPADRMPVMIEMNRLGDVRESSTPGIDVRLLFEDARETVVLQTWRAHAHLDQPLPDGAELLVLDGSLSESGDELVAMSWLRIPRGGRLRAAAGAQGAQVWVKTRHLRFVSAPTAT
jgi:hypothetical protein